MGFRIQFNGGPFNNIVETRRSLPEVVSCAEEARAAGVFGIYRLHTVSGDKATMNWHELPITDKEKAYRASLSNDSAALGGV